MKECPNCGYTQKYVGDENYTNYYGRICTNCGTFIDPEIIPQFIANNKNKQDFLKQTLKNQLKRKIAEKKLNLGDK